MILPYLLLLQSTSDSILTEYALHKGCQEKNPVAKTFGRAAYILKFVGSLIGIAGYSLIEGTQAQPIADAMFLGVNGLYGAVTVSNIYQLDRKLRKKKSCKLF